MVTQKDIAAAAGVARSTVAIALGNVYSKSGARVSEEKRAHIKNVAKKMGYVVDDMARAVKTGKTKVIGLITNGAPPDLIHGLNLAAEEGSFLVKSFTVSKQQGQTPIERVNRMINIIVSQRLAGVIIHYGGKSIYTLIKFLEANNIPCIVTCALGGKHDKTSYFYPDDKGGGAMVADHFLKMGYSNFACIGGEKSNYPECLRVRGFCNTLKKNHLLLPGKHIISSHRSLLRIKKVKKMLSSCDKFPLAVFCTSDSWAINTLTACLSMGLNVPGDVAICGYGNYPLTPTVTPSLTSVEENHFERGFKACKYLLEVIENKTKPKCKTFDVQLVERDSSMPKTKLNKNKETER